MTIEIGPRSLDSRYPRPNRPLYFEDPYLAISFALSTVPSRYAYA